MITNFAVTDLTWLERFPSIMIACIWNTSLAKGSSPGREMLKASTSFHACDIFAIVSLMKKKSNKQRLLYIFFFSLICKFLYFTSIFI